jgi:hypothetical protein
MASRRTLAGLRGESFAVSGPIDLAKPHTSAPCADARGRDPGTSGFDRLLPSLAESGSHRVASHEDQPAGLERSSSYVPRPPNGTILL